MKIAVIWSSPNTNGLTASVKNSFIEGVVGAKCEIDEIHLNKMNLETCRACGNGWGTCPSAGKCVINDGFESIYARLREADGIVFVTAVYWSDMTEQMKKFIDRLRRCEATHNHFLKGKRCILIACAGGMGNGSIECIMQMERALNHMSMRAYDRISVVRYNKDYMLPMLKEAGRTYVDRLTNGFDMYY